MSPPPAIYVLARPASAVSDEAQHVLDSATQLRARVESSFGLFGRKMAVMTMLDALAASHAEHGWDGEQALPVSHAAIALAADFIRALPDGIDLPDVGIEPDGAVTLDWLPSRHRMLSVSFGGGSNRLAYAWLDGSDRGNGVVRFDRQVVPRPLMEAIAVITQVAGHAGVRAA